MSIVRRVALPCGIAGGVWGVLAPVVILLMGAKEVSLLVLWLGFIALTGMLGLLAVVLSKRSHKLGKPLLWMSGVAILLVSLIDIAIGLLFLPASILLLVAAFSLKRELSVVQ